MKPSLIHICTQNPTKYSEYLACFSLHSPKDNQLVQANIEMIEPKSLSLKEVALNKAIQAYEKIKGLVLVDDTGLFFSAYNQFPGTYTKFLAETLGIKIAYKLAKDSDSYLYFQSILCLYDGKEYQTFSGEMTGRLNREVENCLTDKLTYDDIFIPDGYNSPLASLSLDERIKVSHRSKAVEKLARHISHP